MEAVNISRAIVLILCFGSSAYLVASAEQPAIEPESCIERLLMPQYPVAARAAGISGVVNVVVTVNGIGGATWKINSEKAHFTSNVEEALEKSQFASRCQGKTIEIEFQFVVTPPRRSTIRQEVEFIPPLRFRIVTNLMTQNP
jgi:hypothetical protein